MAWAEVCISVERQATEALEDALLDLGALAVTLEDAADQPVLEPGPGETPLWPSVQVRGLFEAGVQRGRITSGLVQQLGIGRPDSVCWRDVGDRDWERAWLDRFQPMSFGEHLWIVPSGMSIPSDPDNIEIRLDPGLAFGTGTHPTTALCLEWLDGHELDSKHVVDYGCGSGILGIAAALKGSPRIDCVDNDPQALEATADNAARNDVVHCIRCWLPEAFESAHGCGTADVVLANILAGPLVELAPQLCRMLAPGGSLVLSGILEEQAEMVAAAYRQRIGDLHSEASGGWIRLVGVKK